MGGCCPGSGEDKESEGQKFEKGKDNDISNGPVANRGCTDILCCILWVLHIGIFVIVAGSGLADGNPTRLYTGRDFQGNFCGTNGNWETKLDLEKFGKIFYAMNVTPLVDDIAKNYVCSSTGKQILTTGIGENQLMTDDDYALACPRSEFSVSLEDAKREMEKYKDPREVINLLQGSGGNILSQVTKYFVAVCVPSCDVTLGSDARSYEYSPGPDQPWKKAWDKVYSNMPDDVKSSFAFQAFDTSKCPYEPKYCVPFPGLAYADIAGYCTMSLSPETSESLSSVGVDTSQLDALVSDSASAGITQDFGTMIGDIAVAWPSLVVTALLSLIVGISFMILLRFTVGFVVWGAVILVFLIFVCGGLLAVTGATQCKGDSLSAAGTKLQTSAIEQGTAAANSTVQAGSTDEVETVELPQCANGYEIADPTQRDILTYIGYALVALGALYGLIIICIIKKIRIAIAINKVAAQFVYNTKMVIFVPIGQILVFLVYMAIWIFVIVFIISQVVDGAVPKISYATYAEAYGTDTEPGQCTNKWPTGGVWKDEFSDDCLAGEPKCWKCYPPRYGFNERFAFAFFSYLWNNAFLIAFGQMTIAGACAVWYFTPNAEKGQRPAVRTGVCNSIRYHTGTMAFGSFILAVVQFIRYFMYYLQKQAEANKNAVVAMICRLLQYLIACFERCIKFLNKNAYIQCALLGTSFCKSAWNAFMLIIRNAARIGLLGGIGMVIHFIGTCFIMLVTTFAGYQVLKGMHKDEIMSPVFPTAIMFMMGYCAAKLVMNVYGLAVDTILQCFVADEEMNKESGQMSACTPELLKTFMENQDKGGGCVVL